MEAVCNSRVMSDTPVHAARARVRLVVLRGTEVLAPCCASRVIVNLTRFSCNDIESSLHTLCFAKDYTSCNSRNVESRGSSPGPAMIPSILTRPLRLYPRVFDWNTLPHICLHHSCPEQLSLVFPAWQSVASNQPQFLTCFPHLIVLSLQI